MLLVRVADAEERLVRARAAWATGAGAAVLSVGIGVTGVVTFAYFSLASHALSRGRVRRHRPAVVGHLHHRVRALPAGGAAALAHDRRPRRARHSRQRAPARGGHDPARASGVLFAVLALVLRGPLAGRPVRRLGHALLDPARGRSAYAASYFARGYLAGHRHFALYGGLVLMEASSRFLFALAVTVGIAERAGRRWRSAWRRAPIVSLAWCPSALARRIAPAPAAPAEPADDRAAERGGRRASRSSPSRHGTGFALAVLVIMLGEQTFLNAGPLLVRGHRGRRRRRPRRLRLQRAADRPRAAAALPGHPDLDPPPPHPPWARAREPTRSGAA